MFGIMIISLVKNWFIFKKK